MKLQFKHQPFQAEAAAAVCDVFRGQSLCAQAHRQGLGAAADRPLSLAGTGTGLCNQPLAPELTDARILKNLHAVQRRVGLPLSKALAGPGINLSVEMETGTGKTYTYVKTIYELNARYGWSRFIIVVPSVAVREGVYRSLQTTQEHFAGEYGRRLRFFIYNSDRLAQVDRFASDSAIQVMIINMQAFNSGRNQRIIDQRPDSFRGRRPIDVIAATRPILIIDEPQSVEGRQTRESLRKFNALFTLRYSATHREAYNMVYRLDALDAYNRHLVKRIAALGVTFTSSPAAGGFVYLEGVDLSRDRAPAARIGFEVKGASGIRTVVKQLRRKADLFAASNGLAEYADRYVVAEIDGRDSSVTFLNGLKLYAGQFSGGEERTALQRRVQIRETIRTHLRRERELYSRGVKVLSLFFIDEVSKYRLYDGDSGSGRSGEYAKMFEEEYVAVAERFDDCDQVGWIELNISCPNVHGGGMGFGTTTEGAAIVTREVRRAVKKPVIVKLTPNVTDIVSIARACEDAGADGLSLINTVLAMRIDPATRRPVLANVTGGLSGAAVFPLAVRMVWQVFEAVSIPIIGMGGVRSARDVIELMLAGATAVGVGAANLVNPYAARDIIDALPAEMEKYGINNLADIIGGAHNG